MTWGRHIFFIVFLCSCAKNNNPINNNNDITTRGTVRTPTVQLSLEEWPNLKDDLDFDLMLTAIDRQLKKFRRVKVKSKIRLGRITYKGDIFKKSLEEFKKYILQYNACNQDKPNNVCLANFESNIKSNFHIFAPTNKGRIEKTLFTAYHTPKLEASLNKTSEYKAGIHLKPIEADLKSLTRNQINFEEKLAGTPYEVMYIKDYFDQYLLHIQGGGKVVYKGFDGKYKSKYLNYDGTNRQAFRFISLYMRDKGYIKDLSVRSQRNFLNKYPHLQEEIYDYSPSYVYFKFSEEPPHGNDAVPLTDLRSIATDYRIYKLKGLVTLVKVKRPIKTESGVRWLPMSRYMIDHDTGGAIKGAARADLYFGEDDYASFVATQMKQKGEMYFFALKP